jgi:hypothetical protein
MKLIVLSLLFAVIPSFLSAGNDPGAAYFIKGKVVDEKGEPLVGAEVIIEGTTTKVYTDFDGNFVIQQNQVGNYTVVCTYISYKETKAELKAVPSGSESTQIQLQKKKLK